MDDNIKRIIDKWWQDALKVSHVPRVFVYKYVKDLELTEEAFDEAVEYIDGLKIPKKENNNDKENL